MAGCGFKVFASAIEAGGLVKAIVVPDGKRLSNSRIKPKGDVCNEAVAAGALRCAACCVLCAICCALRAVRLRGFAVFLRSCPS